jgi:hypothetical protein
MTRVNKAFTFCLCVVTGSLAFALLALPARAQTDTGDNAVCTSATGCTTTSPSTAFIDASAFCGTSGCGSQDFCSVVNKALNTIPASGGVVDARGINPGGSNTCTGDTPYSATYTITNPSTLLLPSGTIAINTTWVLPDRTRIIGEGNNPNGATIMGTLIEANGITASDPMIQMGSTGLCNDPASSGQCYGISISDLAINGANSNTVIDGIWNLNAGASSYIDHVNFEQVGGTGLVIGGNAADSGPYSNLAMSPAGQCTTSTACVKLGDTDGLPLSTRGIHGLTCTCTGKGTSGGTGTAGILLNSPNNTLEDIHFEGYIDGIRAGSLTPLTGHTIDTRANVIFNVNGGGNNIDTMTNVVRVCALTAPGTATPCGNSGNIVSDLTIEAVSASRSCGTCNLTNVIEDDLTNNSIPFLNQLQTSVDTYVLGEALPGGSSGTYSYSLFATNPVAGISTWGVGSASPTSSCQSGSLFSNTAGTGAGGNTLWVCKSTVWKAIK